MDVGKDDMKLLIKKVHVKKVPAIAKEKQRKLAGFELTFQNCTMKISNKIPLVLVLPECAP